MSQDIDLRKIVADVAAGYFKKNRVAPSDISAVIDQISASLSASLSVTAAPAIEPSPEPPPEPGLSRAQIRASITLDALISFEDNKPYKTLRRHLAARGLSPDDYRRKWGLPADYPMAAQAYREARASLAKARGGVGHPARAAVPPQPPAAAPIAPQPQVALQPEPAAEPPPVLKAAPAKPAPLTLSALLGLRPGVRQGGLPKPPSAPSAFRPRASARGLETSNRHQRWLAMLSETDWARIRAAARQVNHAHVPAALVDLSAPLRVRTCLVGHEARFPGEAVGTLRDGKVAVLISEPGEA